MKEINIKLPCPAFIFIGVFTSELVSSLSTYRLEGIINEYDPVSKYVEWEIDGKKQPNVHISSVIFKP